MKLNLLLGLGLFLTTSTMLSAQSYAFGLKGGPTIGMQNWNGFQRNALFAYHGIAFIESAPEENAFAIFAQLGYHMKGSAIRNQIVANIFNNQIERLPPQRFEFQTISLTLGGKQKYDFGLNNKAYYLLGIRGDYTVGTNLKEYEFFSSFLNTLIYPIDGFVQKFNYGATVGGGLEFPFSEFIAGLVEFTVNPDFSYQYRQPQINAVYNPYTNNNETIGERLIRNVTFEITIGIRFLHKIVYVD